MEIWISNDSGEGKNEIEVMKGTKPHILIAAAILREGPHRPGPVTRAVLISIILF
jgi:hypothetical protein